MLQINQLQMYVFPKFKYLEYIAVCVLPYITWQYLYKTYKEEVKNYEDAVLFQKRHNCVLMYYKGKGHTGWPTNSQKVDLNIKNIEILFEPFLYFINTAKTNLDIAIMSINVKSVIEALINAHERGVKVRVVSNFYMNGSTTDNYKVMKRTGIPITFFVSKDKTNSIMHTKFIVKDYKDSTGGYLLMGSFNMTYNAFSSNYEDLVFTSKRSLVKDYHKNFNRMWKDLTEDNNNMFNRLILENSGFIP
ncbi:hypothetical protein HHI36_019130 [Cryptolaemus montrouzieri]|uniref:Mitochondrial cardiolipin hydrolase n=1 Tax=Cryptolaemus montrouzieri TaxID=559131 RepID=A0ABD2P1Z7_9CUCU